MDTTELYLSGICSLLLLAPWSHCLDVRAMGAEVVSVIVGAAYGLLCAVGEGL